MGSSLRVPPAPPTRSRKRNRKRRPDPAALLLVVNGALAGVTGVYLSTHSTLVTLIAALAAVVLGLILLLGR
jgi:hypothetical protein